MTSGEGAALMPLTHDPAEDVRRELLRRFPGWLIGRCKDLWWAWRKLTRPQERAGCHGYLEAGDHDGLAEQLSEQERTRSAVAP